MKTKNIMGENMAEENIQANGRQKRVKRLKKTIILLLIISIAIPTLLSVILAARTTSLSKSVASLSGQVEQLTQVIAEQQSRIDELAGQLQKSLSDSAAAEPGNLAFGAVKKEEGSGVSEAVQSQGIEQETEILQKEEPEADISAKRKVYLTFDDGPSIYTQDILDILARYDVKATFFVLGKESDTAKEALKRIVEEGHTLGIHSYSHKYSQIYASAENFAADFDKLRDYLYEVTGELSTVCRFPGGSSNAVSDIPMEECAKYVTECGVQYFDWNISSEDASGTNLPVEQIVQNSMQNIEKYNTAIILFHDSADKKTTVEALPIIIENILAMEDTVILPITEDTEPVQHIKWQTDDSSSQTKGRMED